MTVTVTRPKRDRSCFIIVALAALVIGAFIVCFGSIFGGVYLLVKPARDATGEFLDALRREDYDQAFALMAPEYQAQFETAGRLQSFVLEFQRQPSRWSINSVQVNNDLGTMRGSIRLADGSSRSLLINVRRIDGQWLVYYADFLTR